MTMTKRLNRTLKDERGFTLIEMLMSLLVMGILMSISIPSIRGHMARADLRAGAREIVATLRNARDKAINEQVPRIVQFDETSKTFQLKKLVKTGPTSYAWEVERVPDKVEPSVTFTANFPSVAGVPVAGVSIPADAVYFGTRGRYPSVAAVPPGPYTATLTSSGTSRTVTITVYERTGEVTGV